MDLKSIKNGVYKFAWKGGLHWLQMAALKKIYVYLYIYSCSPQILQETEKERQTLRDLMDRFNELRRLEKSIEEVHALFMRIQTLVLEQSETIQRVEFHAQQATLFVDKGADELDQAEKNQKKARKVKESHYAICNSS